MNSNFTLSSFIKNSALLIVVFALSVSIKAQDIIRVSSVNTDLDEIVLSNLGSTTVEVGTYWLCLGPGTYVQVSAAASANTNLGPGESVTVSYDVNPSADGFSLFSTNSFGSNDPSILVDYVQWGAANQPRVDQAVAAGRWDDAANFVTGGSPYVFNGGADDFGSSFWNSTLGINDSFESKVSIFPIPASEELNIQITDEATYYLSIELYDISGRMVVKQSTNGALNNLITVRDLQSGIYLLNIVDRNEVVMTKKIVVR